VNIHGYLDQIKNQLSAQNVKAHIGIRREIMKGKTRFEDIKIICMDCKNQLFLESTRNDTDIVYVCKVCGYHVNVKVNG
jgi:rubredoxin